jgi:hypothetical protein
MGLLFWALALILPGPCLMLVGALGVGLV